MLNLEQTMAMWGQRVGMFTPHYVQDVFNDDTETEKAHRRNCVALIKKGYLVLEVDDGVPPYQRDWDARQRYLPAW